METNSNDAIRGAVERGLGAAFLSSMLVERDLAEGRLVSPAVQGLRAKRQLYLLTDPDRMPPPPARAFLSFINDWLRNTAG